MNNELENKLKSLTDLAKNFGFGKEEAVKLTKNLISEYKISFADLYPDMSARFEEVKELCGKIQKTANGLNEKIETRSETSEPNGVTLPFEVIYAGGIRSKQTISGRVPIGVVVSGNKLLYWQESGEAMSRSDARNYMNRLPEGYRWHLMNYCEASGIKNIVYKVNETLRAIGGDVIGSRNYMLDGDGQSSGIVRYVAEL